MRRVWLGLIALPVATPLWAADDEYRTPETVVQTKLRTGPAAASTVTGHLGVQFRADGKPAVEDVEPDSPAEKAGLKPGDVIARIDGKEAASADAVRAILHEKGPGERVKFTVSRQDKPVELTAVLAPASKPMKGGRPQPSLLGVEVAAVKDGEGVTIEEVLPRSVADRAKLKVGETILKVDDTALTGPDKLRELLATKKPDDTVTLTLLLAEKRVELKVKLETERTTGPVGPGRPGGWNRARYWTKPTYRIALIGVEYPDAKHNPKITPKDWAEAMFSQGGKYTKTATGQAAFGSMYDYYWEQSYGQLKVEGKAFDYVEVAKKRAEYGTGNRTGLLTEAMEKLLSREGKDALKEFDGVFFIYAGPRMQVARGSLYWPHKGNFTHAGQNWPYFICPEGGDRMANISVFCHEFGHMLGLPDLYASPENPGMEGVGVWCAMSQQAGNGRPQHFSAWCKEKLGWIKPAVIDPTVKQKIVLSPVEDSPKEYLKVLVQPDGSEYLLLENRKQTKFDQSLPAGGLLIWRVVGNRPILEESHGVTGPSGPRVFATSVPYPSSANDAFTPFTTPSSRSQLGGGLPVYITNIQKRPDGKVTFQIGYEYQ